MYEYASGLVSRGHEVTVFTTDVLDEKGRAGPAFELMEGIRVHRFRNVSNSLAWRAKKYLPPGLPAALAKRAGAFDAIHVTDTRTLLTATAYLTSRARAVPLCLSAHGSLPASRGLRGAVKRRYDRAFVGPMLARAALLLAQTSHEAALYSEHGGREHAIRLLPLPLDAGDRGTVSGGGFRRRAGLTDETPMVLFLGRIHELKGLDLLIEALEPLFAGPRAPVLLVVGRDDGHQATVERRFAQLVAGGRVRFLGPLYGDARFEAYAAADVFALTPRHWEETSLAALEAASCGTPVVVAEQADIPGLAAAGGGHVVPLDPAAIATAVEDAIARGPEMGRRAREHVLRQHSKDAVVGLLERYLDEARLRSSA